MEANNMDANTSEYPKFLILRLKASCSLIINAEQINN